MLQALPLLLDKLGQTIKAFNALQENLKYRPA
jgi:hypothetical protein